MRSTTNLRLEMCRNARGMPLAQKVNKSEVAADDLVEKWLHWCATRRTLGTQPCADRS